MQIGLGSYAFRWAVGTDTFRPSAPMDVAALIDETAALGCGLLQVADSHELDGASAEHLNELRTHAERRGVRLQAGTSGAGIERLRRYLDVAAALDADLLRLVLHGNGVEPDLHEAEQALRAVGPDFEASGVRIGIENHFRTPSRDLVALVENLGSPAVGVVLDTANSVMSGEWPVETVSLLAPYAVGLHLKDYAVIPDAEGVGGHVIGRPLGEGWMDLRAVLESVAQHDDDGLFGVVLEHWLPREESEVATLASERSARGAAVELARGILTAWTGSRTVVPILTDRDEGDRHGSD